MNFFRYFFKCICCDDSFLALCDPNPNFPLCSLCQASLLTAPPQCGFCGGPECFARGGACHRPWRALSGIHSYSARYLMMGQGYEVLKKWKKRSGVLFDRQILRATPELLENWQTFAPQRIVPIPQRFNRAWILKGSRAREIAQWVAQCMNIPYVNALSLMAKNNQAQLGLKDRMLNRIHYEAQPATLKGIKRVILVDDFMTSGRTLRQAAEALLQSGVEDIHCFCLGLRAQRTHLSER